MFRACAVAAFLFVLASPAVADAIDCDWCGGKGLHLTIKGPEINCGPWPGASLGAAISLLHTQADEVMKLPELCPRVVRHRH